MSDTVIVLELRDPDDLERALSLLRVLRLPAHRVHAAVQHSAAEILAVFKDRPDGADAWTEPED